MQEHMIWNDQVGINGNNTYIFSKLSTENPRLTQFRLTQISLQHGVGFFDEFQKFTPSFQTY